MLPMISAYTCTRSVYILHAYGITILFALKFGNSNEIYVDIPNQTVVLNVGGGYETVESYFTQHDPCRKTSKLENQKAL